MTTRATKLNKSNVRQYGVMSQIDNEIRCALSDYKNAGDSLYWKKREISELNARRIALERETAGLERKRVEILETLHDLFFRKDWHAPSLESVNRAMDEIVKFRKEHAQIDDNGDIISGEKNE